MGLWRGSITASKQMMNGPLGTSGEQPRKTRLARRMTARRLHSHCEGQSRTVCNLHGAQVGIGIIRWLEVAPLLASLWQGDPHPHAGQATRHCARQDRFENMGPKN
jgi:hypothetical protein